MAKIPLETGREQITKQPLAVRQTGGVFSSAVSRASQEFAQTAAKVFRQFEEAATLAEKTNANTEALRKLKELNLEAESVKTIQDISKFKTDYPNRISKIREESNKLITLPQAKNEFGRTFDRDAVSFDFKVRKILQDNQNDALEIILNEAQAENKDRYITGDPVEQHIAKTEQNLLDVDARNRGILTTKQLGERKVKRDKEWELAWVDYKIETDAEDALEQLKLGEEGIFANIDAKDRLSKQATANQKINRDAKIAERRLSFNYDNSENALATRIFEGQATIREINEAELQGSVGIEGGVSTSFATVARRALESVKAVAAEDEVKTYGELSRDFYNLGIAVATDISDAPFEQIAGFRAKVMQKYDDGLITAATANSWIKLVTGSYNSATKDIVQSKFRKGKIVNDWIAFGSKRLPVTEQLEAFRFMDRELTKILLTQDIPEDQIDDVARDIFRKYLKANNPEILELKDVPNSLFDSEIGFDNVSNQPSEAESEWEYKDGKLIRVGVTKPIKIEKEVAEATARAVFLTGEKEIIKRAKEKLKEGEIVILRKDTILIIPEGEILSGDIPL